MKHNLFSENKYNNKAKFFFSQLRMKIKSFFVYRTNFV